MNDLYIQGVHIDWNKIPVNSYLREIDAIKGLEELIFIIRLLFCWRKRKWKINLTGGTCSCLWV